MTALCQSRRTMDVRWPTVFLTMLALLLAGPVGHATLLPNDTLHLNYADRGLFGHYPTYCFDDLSRPATVRQAEAQWQAGHFARLPLANGVLQGGYRQQRLWPRVVVNTLSQRPARYGGRRCAAATACGPRVRNRGPDSD